MLIHTLIDSTYSSNHDLYYLADVQIAFDFAALDNELGCVSLVSCVLYFWQSGATVVS